MAGTYGITFSRKLREEGRYDEAIGAADRAAALDPDDPEAAYDRAAALYCVARFQEAVLAFARAIDLDRAAGLLEQDVVDDDLFETLRKWAEAEPARAPELLGRYAEIQPAGRHLEDVDKWLRHLAADPRLS
jgi:tetratricopeptide (TPR) repeat protein